MVSTPRYYESFIIGNNTDIRILFLNLAVGYFHKLFGMGKLINLKRYEYLLLQYEIQSPFVRWQFFFYLAIGCLHKLFVKNKQKLDTTVTYIDCHNLLGFLLYLGNLSLNSSKKVFSIATCRKSYGKLGVVFLILTIIRTSYKESCIKFSKLFGHPKFFYRQFKKKFSKKIENFYDNTGINIW
ncbi:hypothetical protein FWK35_00006805 [Aphis craccivora]|uniref:Uncharacterized protein n=1 Tax=Aphis craccivora TaxID=307492 RepID=A0A6G0ZI09_APHCR|nr:hypothetical protein FWK35_00006805 [Aphis craccivora]